jgi:hypothetical protein
MLLIANNSCPRQETEASCSAIPSCSGLSGDCCPTASGKDLYCCYQAYPSPRYRPEFTLYGHPIPTNNKASYWLSTGDHSEVQVNGSRVYRYRRLGTNLFDLLYLQTNHITDASLYVSGAKKFYMTIDESSDAPPCTQIILQLDSIPAATDDNYPTGRHSRYLATYTPTSNRLEFNFIDRPDPSVPDVGAVNAVALLFEPGIFVAGSFVYSFLDSAVSCDNIGNGVKNDVDPECQPSPVNGCQAVHVDEICTNDDQSCNNPTCAGEPLCRDSMATSYLALEDKRVMVVSGSVDNRRVGLWAMAAVAAVASTL